MREVSGLQSSISTPPEYGPAKDGAKFNIVGSGIIGLLVAHELADHGHNVTILSGEGKPNLDTDSSSSIAVGQFLPWLPEGHAQGVMTDMDLQEIVAGSEAFYEALAANPHETGVMRIENIELVGDDLEWPGELPDIMHVLETKLDEPVPFLAPDGTEATFDTTYTFNTFSINTRKTIAYLADRAEQAGVTFEKRKLTPDELHQLDGIIVNAAGMGASEFDATNEVKNYKGHTFLLKPKAGYQPPQQALSVDDLIIMPREDGTIICGALYIEDPEHPIPTEQEAEQLKKKIRKSYG